MQYYWLRQEGSKLHVWDLISGEIKLIRKNCFSYCANVVNCIEGHKKQVIEKDNKMYMQ